MIQNQIDLANATFSVVSTDPEKAKKLAYARAAQAKVHVQNRIAEKQLRESSRNAARQSHVAQLR